MDKEQVAAAILHKARAIGFSAAGFAPVSRCREETERLLNMIREHRHGEMVYMQQGLAARTDPRNLLPEAKTVLSAALPYTFPLERDEDAAKISRYAMVPDYHRELRARLGMLLDFIGNMYPGQVTGKVCVDSLPVFEKSWAEKARLGMTGKNTMLIVPGTGSFVFLGEIVLDIELPASAGLKENPCNGCDACLRSCPTGAILESGKLDARKCISYLTVELKRDFTPKESAMTGPWLFGCDICQEVCPHNTRQCSPSTARGLSPRKELTCITPEEILALTRSRFRILFAGTPIWRTGLKRLKRNARAVIENLKEC